MWQVKAIVPAAAATFPCSYRPRRRPEAAEIRPHRRGGCSGPALVDYVRCSGRVVGASW